MTKTDKAYEWMVQKIQTGMEFPEAHTQACTRFNLSPKQAKELTERYDNAQE